jgi:hypothetical protein
MRLYYADPKNQTAGPVTLEALQGLIKEGQLKNDPMVVIEGRTDWKLLSATNLEPKAPTPGMAQATQAAEQAKAASKDAWEVLKIIATDPVAGLAPAFEKLGPPRAKGAGFAFGGVSALCGLFLLHKILTEMGLAVRFGDFLKMVVVALVPFASLFAVCLCVKTVFRGKGDLAQDAYVAGTSQLPIAMLMLAAALLGFDNNNEVLVVIGLFALCLTALMLFAGFVRIYKLTEQLATLAVPVAVLVVIWASKMVFTSMFRHF